jgi:hypothetical protein
MAGFPPMYDFTVPLKYVVIGAAVLYILWRAQK